MNLIKMKKSDIFSTQNFSLNFKSVFHVRPQGLAGKLQEESMLFALFSETISNLKSKKRYFSGSRS